MTTTTTTATRIRPGPPPPFPIAPPPRRPALSGPPPKVNGTNLPQNEIDKRFEEIAKFTEYELGQPSFRFKFEFDEKGRAKSFTPVVRSLIWGVIMGVYWSIDAIKHKTGLPHTGVGDKIAIGIANRTARSKFVNRRLATPLDFMFLRPANLVIAPLRRGWESNRIQPMRRRLRHEVIRPLRLKMARRRLEGATAQGRFERNAWLAAAAFMGAGLIFGLHPPFIVAAAVMYGVNESTRAARHDRKAYFHAHPQLPRPFHMRIQQRFGRAVAAWFDLSRETHQETLGFVFGKDRSGSSKLSRFSRTLSSVLLIPVLIPLGLPRALNEATRPGALEFPEPRNRAQRSIRLAQQSWRQLGIGRSPIQGPIRETDGPGAYAQMMEKLLRIAKAKGSDPPDLALPEDPGPAFFARHSQTAYRELNANEALTKADELLGIVQVPRGTRGSLRLHGGHRIPRSDQDVELLRYQLAIVLRETVRRHNQTGQDFPVREMGETPGAMAIAKKIAEFDELIAARFQAARNPETHRSRQASKQAGHPRAEFFIANHHNPQPPVVPRQPLQDFHPDIIHYLNAMARYEDKGHPPNTAGEHTHRESHYGETLATSTHPPFARDIRDTRPRDFSSLSSPGGPELNLL